MHQHTRRAAICAVLLSLSAGLPAVSQERSVSSPPKTVVFVCEHGAARSVIAAAWFNKLAAEKHLAYHAVARGVTPQEELSTSTVAGLRREGVDFAADKPSGLTKSEADSAVRVMAFFALPSSMKPKRPESTFEVPAPGDGYDQSRDAILVHVRALLDDLQGKQK